MREAWAAMAGVIWSWLNREDDQDRSHFFSPINVNKEIT
ncbi:hypothetical protein C4K04_1650 [Pseudomonas chlororaphis]|uniref:Uncharacterized protein n=1 Tax=Pseudomonas chlororaphis TaxID=587753 RepID=A0A3G7TL74_9PSED|nr:hypothetical protein C4K04_1650 [Pseudomonas chlororaphis]